MEFFFENQTPFINAKDDLNPCMVEKKSFEHSLDEMVANGMDKTIQVMLNDFHSILEKNPPDYFNESKDLLPSSVSVNKKINIFFFPSDYITLRIF